jgi:N-acyl homoserine lactone hydrolase
MKIAILDSGLFKVHENGRVIGIPGFLIRSGAYVILVDTGFPARYATDPEGAARDDNLGAFGSVLALTTENLPTAQLARLGLRPADVTHLVLSHTHIDHVGGIGDFPQATIVVGAAERALDRPLYWGDRRPFAWPEQQYLTVEGDLELAPGVTLLSTPGHTPGHISLLLQPPAAGAALLTADAISRPQEVVEDRYGGAWDAAQARASARRLLQLARDTGATLIYGHDPAQWPTLPKAPRYLSDMPPAPAPA